METGKVNLACMELLDRANTETLRQARAHAGAPQGGKRPVHRRHRPRPAGSEAAAGADRGKGVNVYTHGEMLPAHAYPELKKYPQLKGNFGTAWQNQQKEFDAVSPRPFSTPPTA
jgi:hydroxylamine reductase